MLSLPIVDNCKQLPSYREPLAGVLMKHSLAIDPLSPQDPSGVLAYGWQARRGHPAGLGAKENADGRRLFPHPCSISEGR